MQVPHGSLIARMGGVEAASGLLVSTVEVFYSKLLSDDRLAVFFEGVDTDVLKRKQVAFLAFVFGGPDAYAGKGIWEAHEHLIRGKGLDETHFDIVTGHFRDTLLELGTADEVVDEAIAILNTARPLFEHKNLPPTSQTTSSTGGAINPNTTDDCVESSITSGMENIPAVAGKLQELLLTSDQELAEKRAMVKRMMHRANSKAMERVRGALRLRGPGLVDLFDQAMLE